MDFKGKVAVVTGASSGMGFSISDRLASEGMQVALIARSRKPLEVAEEKIRSKGGNAHFFCTDVRDENQVKSMVEDVLEKFGRIDLLVNNAFWAPPGSLETVTEEIWDRTVDTTLKGAFLCTRAVVPHFKETGSGSIVNIGSIASKAGEDKRSPYCAAKWGLEGFTAALREELGKFNIRVHLITPAATDTSSWKEYGVDLTEEQKKRMIPPEVIADAVFWVLDKPQAVLIPEVVIRNFQDPFPGKSSPFEDAD